MKTLVNFAAFQLGWFSCVLGAANDMPWVGPIVVLAVVVLHLMLVSRPVAELKLLALAMTLGLLLDSLLMATGWLKYSTGLWIHGLAPYWIIAMWALFATTLNVSMRWMRGSLPLAILMGFIGGPLSYMAGAKLGAMTVVEAIPALAALAVIWALTIPCLTILSARFDGNGDSAAPPYVLKDWRLSGNV